MDTQSYNEFLKSRLREVQKPLDNSILNLLNNKIDDTFYRQVGMRSIIVEILSKLDELLKDFYKSADNNTTLEMDA